MSEPSKIRQGRYREQYVYTRGLTLVEVLAAVVLVGILAVAALARFSSEMPTAKKNACHVQKGHIEVQCQLWLRDNGSLPASNLSDIGASSAHFPDGVPQCPIDGTAYTLDPATQKVSGHLH